MSVDRLALGQPAYLRGMYMSADVERTGLAVQAAALHAGYLGWTALMQIDRDGTVVRGPLSAIEVSQDRAVNSKTGYHVQLTIGPVQKRVRADDLVVFSDLSEAPGVPEIPSR